jgi:hypothetical protein
MIEPPVSTYVCLFFGQGIPSGPLDPCAVHLIGKIDRPRNEQMEQTFFCHVACIQGLAKIDPANFYITDPDFSSVGDVDEAE